MSFWKKLFGGKKSSCCGSCETTSVVLNLPAEEKEILKNCDEKIVIGKILEIEAHPDPKMTKVRVTKTDIGNGVTEQILCGGVNIVVGAIVPVATVGTVLGEDFMIGEREIRGVVSRGMICSRSELNLPQGDEPDHGIWILPAECEAFLGKSLQSLL
jgi:phenylalanyl-tRNA synthetase beta chain